jgi:predicted DNA binding CopG/RHH family protein
MAPCDNLSRVPNMPATPNRTIRVPDELWEAVKRKASDRGETVTDVILRALRRYLRDYDD